MEFYQIFTFFSEIFLPLICSAISIYVIPVLNKFIEDKRIREAVKVAVLGVEQYMDTDEGSEKKLAVYNYILSKFDVSTYELDLLIEATVYELNNV